MLTRLIYFFMFYFFCSGHFSFLFYLLHIFFRIFPISVYKNSAVIILTSIQGAAIVLASPLLHIYVVEVMPIQFPHPVVLRKWNRHWNLRYMKWVLSKSNAYFFIFLKLFILWKNIQWDCKSVGSHASIWGKTTLITGIVGGAEAGPPMCKMGTFFHIPLALTMPISNNF